MKKDILLGILYVSCLIVIWGSIGSLIDYAFLQRNLYTEGSLGQLSTFSISGLLFTVLGIQSFSIIKERIFKSTN
ncbi:hypothetical protein [Prochlorococcus sp. MIT 1223]|uniref:hypothetical protein n=1 Tax=Prochlorococcus sp. MIT 1223 TaxID=3096217 RepID=UPI002A75CB16|nr:hypothetical protein [Prochlorococcus sp. MIT 1223]